MVKGEKGVEEGEDWVMDGEIERRKREKSKEVDKGR